MLFTILLCFLSYVSNIFGSPSPIIGGVDAEERKYQYQVSLQEIGRTNQHYCGGSIISDSWILTAAHCVDNNRIINDNKKIQIVAGIIHFQKTIANDIALLETTEKIQFSAAVRPVALAIHNPPDRTLTRLAGWGFASDNAVGVYATSISNTLQVAHFETISLQECRKQFNDATYPGKLVIQTNICIAQTASKAQCNGDSGGAVITNNWTQIGIVSFGGLCSDGVPGVATSVAKYLNWIKGKSGI